MRQIACVEVAVRVGSAYVNSRLLQAAHPARVAEIIATQVTRPDAGTQIGTRTCCPGGRLFVRRSRRSDRFTIAKTSSVATDVLSARRSNGSSKAITSAAVATNAVAMMGVAVLECTCPVQAGRSPCRAIP